MDKIKSIIDSAIEIFFSSSFSFFELLSLYIVTNLTIRFDSLWWMLLYLPVVIISVIIQSRLNK